MFTLIRALWVVLLLPVLPALAQLPAGLAPPIRSAVDIPKPPPHLALHYNAGGDTVMSVWLGSARLWSVATGTERQVLGCDVPLESAFFTPDGKRVVARSGADTLLYPVYRADTPKRYAGYVPFVEPGNKVERLQFSGDRLLVREPGGLRLLNLDTGQAGPVMRDPQALHALLSADGTQLLSGGPDGTARLWDTGNGKQILRRGGRDAVQRLGFSHDGRAMLVGRAYGTEVLNIADGREILSSVDAHAVLSLSGPYLLEQRGRSAVMLALADRQPICTWRHKLKMIDYGFSGDGKKVFFQGPTRTVLADIGSCEVFKKSMLLMQRPKQLQFIMADDGAQALTVGSGMANLWVFPTFKRPTAMFMDWPQPARGAYPVVFSPRGDQLATAAAANRAHLVSLPDGAVQQRLTHASCR